MHSLWEQPITFQAVDSGPGGFVVDCYLAGVYLTDLQEVVNQGGVGVIVAENRIDSEAGHIVLVVPETDAYRALRTNTGEVTAPLQSQAGRFNFAYRTGNIRRWANQDRAWHAF
jgi:hypothetical protein